MYKKINGSKNYYVTSRGRIYKKWDVVGFVELKCFVEPSGYASVNIVFGEKLKKKLVHRLVAECFLEGLSIGDEVNHINGNKSDNKLENLEVVNRSQNMLHSSYILKNNVRKVVKIDLISFKLTRVYDSIKQAGEDVGVHPTLIGLACRGERKKTGGYAWCYFSDYNPEHVEKMKKRINKNNRHKEIEQIDIESGRVLRVFASIKEAKEETKISTISHVLSGKCKTGGGYSWRYKVNENVTINHNASHLWFSRHKY